MSVAFDQVLTLVGPLDDQAGSDTPSQRFRRYLTREIPDVGTVRALIDACGATTGVLERRALQDLLISLGRFLGFNVVFGCYEPLAGILDYHGHWQSPHGRRVVIEVRTESTTSADVRRLMRSAAALAATSFPSLTSGQTKPIALSVTTPRYARRVRLESAFQDHKTGDRLRLMSSSSLVTLAEMVSGDRLTHADCLRLLDSGVVLDPMVAMLARAGAASGVASHAAQFWLATIPAHDGVRAAQAIDRIRAQRTFTLTGVGPHTIVRPPDRICFCAPGTGVVGHAEVASLGNAGELRLREVRVYLESPAVPGLQTQLRLTAAYTTVERGEAACLPLSEAEFNELTHR